MDYTHTGRPPHNFTFVSSLRRHCLQPEDLSFFSAEVDPSVSLALSSVAMAPPGGLEADGSPREFPVGFEPLRSDQVANMAIRSSPVVLDPYCSPLLAPDSLLRGLPPVHLVVRPVNVHLVICTALLMYT